MLAEPDERKTGSSILVLPLNADLGFLKRGVPDARPRRQVGDIDQTLAIVAVAILRQVIAQPDTGKLTGGSVTPLDGQEIRSSNYLGGGGV